MKAVNESQRARIMVFTDEPQLALGATCLLSSAGDFEIVRGPAHLVELLPSMKQERPDILLIDLGPEVTLALIGVLREAVPACRIVLWARSISDEVSQQAREQGAAGVVRRNVANEAFVEHLRRVFAGHRVFEAHAPGRATKVQLSRRESQIVGLLAQGLKNKEIGSCLGVTEGTVKSYLVRLFQKVGARDRFELAILGLKNTYCGQASWDGPNSFVTEREEARARPVLRSLVLVEPERRAGYPEQLKRPGA